jgi:hypothetical protein
MHGTTSSVRLQPKGCTPNLALAGCGCHGVRCKFGV